MNDLKFTDLYNSQQVTTKAGMGCGWVMKEPFGNCQICIIGAFNNLLTNLRTLEERQDALITIYKERAQKSELMIDVKSGFAKEIEELFLPKEIIFKTPYINNTGSSMIVYLLQYIKMIDRVTTERSRKKTEETKAAKTASKSFT